jgi:hypothetical protein
MSGTMQIYDPILPSRIVFANTDFLHDEGLNSIDK